MTTNAPMTLDFRDLFFLAPEIVLVVWGLLVLLVDLGLARRLSSAARRRTIGWLSLAGVALAFLAAGVTLGLSLSVQANPQEEWSWLGPKAVAYFSEADPSLFFGTLAGDAQTGFFNLLFIFLLGLVLYLSMAWSFTEDWGEYFALMFWATVGMMLLAASEELITLFITLETMTICLYLGTAMEKTRRRSAEGGLKYFVYGSVSSALFLFGLSLIYGMTGTTQFEGIRKVLLNAGPGGLSENMAGATAVLLLLVGFGFKVAAVPFHQWAPDAYEGAPAPVTAWIATGSKLASFVALMKVFLHALLPWSSPSTSIMGPGWVGIVAIISAITMTYGNFAALAQRNLKRMLAYSSIAHAGYILVGVAAVSVSAAGAKSAGAVLYYLVVYAFANVGAFAVAAWLVRDKKTDDIDDLNGLGYQYPLLATCILVLMLSLIGIPPLAGFFAKLYVFMEALGQRDSAQPVILIWLVALGLFNSVVSAFYYVRVLKAMFLRDPGPKRLAPAGNPISLPILLGTLVVVIAGIIPGPVIEIMQAEAAPMLTTPPTMTPLYTSGPVPGARPAGAAAVTPVPRVPTPVEIKALPRNTGGGPRGMNPSRKSAPAKKAAGGASEAAPTKKAATTPDQKADGKSASGTPEKASGQRTP